MNKITEFLKQAFFICAIVTCIAILNTQFRPDYKHQKDNTEVQIVQTEVIKKQVIQHSYVDANTIGLILVGTFSMLVFFGFIHGLRNINFKRKPKDIGGKFYI